MKKFIEYIVKIILAFLLISPLIIILTIKILLNFEIYREDHGLPFERYLLTEVGEPKYPKPSNRYLLEHGVLLEKSPTKKNIFTLCIVDAPNNCFGSGLNIIEYAWQENNYNILYFRTIDYNIYIFNIDTHLLLEMDEEDFSSLSTEWYPAFRSVSY